MSQRMVDFSWNFFQRLDEKNTRKTSVLWGRIPPAVCNRANTHSISQYFSVKNQPSDVTEPIKKSSVHNRQTTFFCVLLSTWTSEYKPHARRAVYKAVKADAVLRSISVVFSLCAFTQNGADASKTRKPRLSQGAYLAYATQWERKADAVLRSISAVF